MVQEVLTTVFGFGVLTVATVALLNVACLRLHDVQKKDKTATDGSQMNRFVYVYVYDCASAFGARDKLRHSPSFLAWMGVGAIVFVQILYGIAYLTTYPNERESTNILGVITWMSIASYVLALLCVSAVVSNKVYGVLDKVNRD